MSFSIFCASLSCEAAEFSTPETMRCQGSWKILQDSVLERCCETAVLTPKLLHRVEDGFRASSVQPHKPPQPCASPAECVTTTVVHGLVGAHLKPVGNIIVSFVDKAYSIVEDRNGLVRV